MQGWVDLVGRLHTAMVYSPEDGHPSQYEPGSVYCCIVDTPNDADHYYAMPRAKVLLWRLLLGGDTVDYIMSRMSDQSKSRCQVVRQLVQLGLIGSAKELKKMRSPLVGLLTSTTTCSTHLLAFRDLRPSVFDEETTGQLLHTYTPRHTRGELEITALNLQPDGAIQICLLLLFLPWYSIPREWKNYSMLIQTHTRLMALCPGLPGWAGTRKAKPIWISLKQETVSGSDISWAICKYAPHSRQITMPAPHHSVFLQAGCPSCRPTNSVKALKAIQKSAKIKLEWTLLSLLHETVMQ